jgi:hypothetical protein
MPKIRDILVHVSVEQAQRQRKCRRHKTHKMSKGEMCLVIVTNDTNDDYSYCIEAAKPILDAAWIKLGFLYAGLVLLPPVQSDN